MTDLHIRLVPAEQPAASSGPAPSRKDQATPTVLLHGFTGSAETWGEGILQGLARLGPVLVVDLPGHGRTQDQAPLGGPVMPDFADVVNELVLAVTSRGYARADWVGYSMGGRLALGIAEAHPDRVRRLVIESSTAGLESEAERARRRRQDEALARKLEVEGIEGFVTAWMDRPLFASQEDLPPAVLRDARNRRMRNDPRALAAVLRGMGTGRQPPLWSALSDIRVPTLLLTGALDRKFGRLAQRMTRLMPESRHVTVPDAGHNIHLEAPRAWLSAVIEFLDVNDAGA